MFRRRFKREYLKSSTTVVLFLFVSLAFSVDKGMKEYKRNNFDEARKYYESVLEERKDDPAANFGLGVSAYQQGDIKSAKEKVAGLVTFLKESNQALGDISIEKKLEGLGMELEEMDRASSSTAERSKYLKSKKQQLFYASKGKQAKYLLQEGSLGMEVENLQQALKERDLYLGPIDGVFSSTLKESVIKYQSQNNLKADGIAGPLTLKALGLY